MAADELLQQGFHAQATVSRLDLELRGLEQEFAGVENRRKEYLKAHAPGRLFVELAIALLALCLLAAGELAALALVVADWLGVDLARPQSLLYHPVESGAVALAGPDRGRWAGRPLAGAPHECPDRPARPACPEPRRRIRQPFALRSRGDCRDERALPVDGTMGEIGMKQPRRIPHPA